MADTGRAYADPTPAWVRGAVRGGVEDPALLVEDSWTPTQKQRWSDQFNVLLKASRATEAESQAQAHEQDVQALQASQERVPVVTNVLQGVGQGLGEVGALGLRAASLVSPPPDNEESLADTANRLLSEHEQVQSLADKSSAFPRLSGALRGSVKSVTAAAAYAATGAGPAGVIGGFAASRANQAATEAEDAGLSPKEASGYIGRAAAIEGGVAGAFQLMGLGGAKRLIAGGLSEVSTKELLKHLGADVTQGAVQGVLHAYNKARSEITGPVTDEQLVEVLEDSTIQALLTMGLTKGYTTVKGELQMRAMSEGLAQKYGWDVGRMRELINKAASRSGDFHENLGEELRTEALLKPQVLAVWASRNPDLAQNLAAYPDPTRRQWDEAGMPRTTEEGRVKAVASLRKIMTVVRPADPTQVDQDQLGQILRGEQANWGPGQGPVQPPPPAALENREPPAAAPPAVPEPTPPPAPPSPSSAAGGMEAQTPGVAVRSATAQPPAAAPIVAPGLSTKAFAEPPPTRGLDLIGRAAGAAPKPSYTESVRQQQQAEIAAIEPGSKDWTTADVETLRGLVKNFQVPKDDHALAVERLNLLENPIAKGANWKTADAPQLHGLLKAKAVDPAELDAANARFKQLVGELPPLPPSEAYGPPTDAPPEPAKNTGLKAKVVAPPDAASPPDAAPTAPASSASEPPPSAEVAKPKSKTEGTLALAADLAGRLKKGEATDRRSLKELADKHYGGTLGEHAYQLQDAYEATELALSKAGARDPAVDLGQAKKTVAELGDMLKLVPTQTTRSESKLRLQQFSTPTDYAFAANWVANLRKGDVVLEPSAGTGNLAAHAAEAPDVRVVANEWDKRRAELVKTIADEVHTEDAKQIADILGPKGVKPTVVVMNPPFSADKNRAGRKNLMEATQHIDAALAILPQGGRLVAIVGRGMAPDAPTFSAWWDKVGGTHDVRANVEVSGDVYAKMGTSFGTRLLVIDKVLPDTKSPVVAGSVNTVAELLEKLEGVRNDRPTVGAPDRAAIGGAAAQPGGAPGGVGPVGAPVVAPDVGGKPAVGGGPAGAATGVRGGQPAAGVAGGAGGLPAGGEPGGGSGKQPGRPADVAAGPPALSHAGKGAGLSAAAAPVAEKTAGLNVQAADRVVGEDQGTYEGYRPLVKVPGAKEHPTPLVESAAMASVEAPKVTYSPKLDPKLIESGVLSEAQLEPVIYAGAAHEQTLTMSAAEQEEFRKLSGGQEPPTEKRRGFFDGDGTGVGKGRIAAAVIMDNMNQGRKKAVWISEGKKLFHAAVRDWTAVGGSKRDLKGLHQVEAGEPVKHGDGILFGTYTTLGKGAPPSKEGEAPRLARIEQIVQWAGPKFDGVLVFDESHNAANAVEAKGARGQKKASAMALATVELQRRLPLARVLYMSATGATQVNNLAYADRLGLWGEGTEFANREAFLNSVSAGGVAAMELVARDMKAQGMYLSRTLSFKGVDYSRLTHALEPDQVKMYDDLATAWQVVLANIHEALKFTGPDGAADATQKQNAMGQFWGAQQRFFNQVLTALQMPTVIAALREDLKAGKAPVIQIVNTMEAATDRALKRAKAEAQAAGETEDLADVDLTPRDALMEMVNNAFPIHKYESFTNEDGNTESRAVTDSEGKPVVSQEAVKLKEALLEKIKDVRVPDAPIDQIINEFGHKRVAEVTGRGRRVVRTGKGLEREEQKRSTPAVLEDIRAFMAGERDMLVFSQAGATGESYHADLTQKNQKPRRHYVLQAGWRADKAVQGLGRSHRSNQAHTPEFRLVETDLPGHRRFISTIAKRLEQLGALTRGQRTAGGGGLFTEADNLEGTHAQDALYAFLMDVIDERVPGVEVHDFEEQTGLKLLGDESSSSGVRSIEVKQFLNRMLSLKVDMQHKVFDAYASRLELAVEAARQNGTLDVGMETIRANRIEKVSEQTVRTDARSGAATKHVELKTFVPNERHEFDDVLKRVEGKKEGEVRYLRNLTSQRIYIAAPAGTTTENGKLVDLSVRWGPSGRTIVPTDKLNRTHAWATEEEARADWGEALAALPQEREDRIHLITGALLPVWNQITGKPRVRRATTDKGERFLGRVVEEDDIASVLENLGVSRKFEVPAAKEAHDLLMTGGSLQFANGWTISRKQIQGEPHFEVGGDLRYGDGNLIVDMGGRRDSKAGRSRWFIPTGEGFAAVYERLTKGYQVTKVNRAGSEDRQLSPADPSEPPPTGPGGGAPRPAPVEAVPVSRVDVTKTLERLYPGVTVRGPASFRRRFKIEKATGWFTPALGEVRTRERYDVATEIHELGHYFDRELGKWSRQAGHAPGVDAELTQLGKDLYGDRRPTGGYRSEGFAEFVREYLSGSANLPSRAPNLYRWFTTEYLAENPTEAAKITELGEQVRQFLAQTPQQNVEAFMAPIQHDWSSARLAQRLAGASLGAAGGAAAGGPLGATVGAVIGERLGADPNAEANWRDRNLPILRAMQATQADLSQLEPQHDAYQLLTYYTGAAGGRTQHAALAQTVDLWGRESGAGLRDVLAPITAQGDEAFKAWKEFMVASRALARYHAHGINPGLSKADAEAIVAKNKGRAGFQATAEAFTAFADRALEPLVQAGVMTAEERAQVRELNPVYAPFFRQSPAEGGGFGSGSRKKAVHEVTKTGSNLPIHDIVDATLLQYERIQRVAMQADVVRALVKFYDDHKKAKDAPALAKLLSEVPANTEAVTFSAEQVRKDVLEAAGEDADKVDEALEGLWEDKLKIFRAAKRTPSGGFGEDPVITLTVNGEARHFQVKPDLAAALEGVTQAGFLPGQLGAFLRKVTGLQRLGATGLNASFGLVRNALRDTLTASVTGDYHFHLPVVSTVRGMWANLTNSEYARRYRAAGLAHLGQIGQDMQAAHGLAGQVGAPGAVGALIRPLLPPGMRDLTFSVDGIRELLGASEIGPRLMEYQAAHEATVAKWGAGEEGQRNAAIVAGNAAADVTVNFRRAGVQARKLNEAVLFFNAPIQSADKLLRALGVLEAAPWASTQDRKATAAKTIGKGAVFLTGVALLLYLLQNRGDKDWEELPAHYKWNYFNVKLPNGGFFHIPLPFEAGSIFGALPVAMLEGPAAFAEALRVSGKGASPLDLDSMHGLARNVALLGPIADVLANEDWKGAPIVSEADKSRLPSDQYGPNVSGVARFLGAHAPVEGGVSPAKLEHLLDGYTGGLYKRIAGMADTVTDPSAIQPVSDPSTLPILGTLFLRPGTSRLTGDFYDRLKYLRQRQASDVATLEEQGELAQAERVGKDLHDVWQQRRDAITSDASAGSVKTQTDALAIEARDLIRDHNERAKGSDYATGLSTSLFRATAPSADPMTARDLPEGVSEADAIAALRAEAQRRGESTRARNATTGNLTAFGERQARLLRALRNKVR